MKAHWSDVGGPVPSSMQVGSTDFRQEGLRFRSVRLFDRGELNEEVMRVIAGNIRTESGTLKDVQAMIAVCRVGIAYFQEILGKYGRDTVLDATRVYMEQSERRTRAELARIPSGCTGRWATSTMTASPSIGRSGSRWPSRSTTAACTWTSPAPPRR